MMVVPPALLDLLNLRAGAVVALKVDGERLVVQPQKKPKYTLEELLARCDARAPITDEDREWINTSSVGKEL
jgi:antitoxin ChpS